jgi:hypothetical protein
MISDRNPYRIVVDRPPTASFQMPEGEVSGIIVNLIMRDDGTDVTIETHRGNRTFRIWKNPQSGQASFLELVTVDVELGYRPVVVTPAPPHLNDEVWLEAASHCLRESLR